jgi:transglutaminase-like putative cysteine protease
MQQLSQSRPYAQGFGKQRSEGGALKYQIRHVTRYRYADAVTNSQHDMHLLPRELPHQHCLSATLTVEPRPIVCQDRADYFGNRATHVVLATAHTELVAIAQSRVEVTFAPTQSVDDDLAWEASVAEIVRRREDLHAQEMRFPSPFIVPWPALHAYALDSFPPSQPLLKGCVHLMGRIHREFKYDPRATSIATPLVEVFEKRRGVCQDFAHLMIACLRSLGLSARYVSGYLVTTPPPGQERLLGADASHAWLSVLSPRFGFVDLDPTNNVIPTDAHITLAIGRDFGDVTPLRGVILGGAHHKLHVGVDVVPEEA